MEDKQEHEETWNKIRSILSSWRDPTTLKKLLQEWDSDYGPDFDKLAVDLMGYHMRKYWESIAEKEGNNSIKDLINILWEPFTQSGAEYSVEEATDGYQIYCTKCPIADVYRELSQEKYGFLFHCASDQYICEGFNPNIEFKRTKTLMEGHDCCNHHYSMK